MEKILEKRKKAQEKAKALEKENKWIIEQYKKQILIIKKLEIKNILAENANIIKMQDSQT